MVEHFTSTPSCVSLFFLSRTNFPQNATSPLNRNSVPLQHPEQTISDTTGFQRKMLLFFLKRTVHHSPHPHPTDSTKIFGSVRNTFDWMKIFTTDCVYIKNYGFFH